MTGFVMFLHAVVSILLLVIILMQSGRGGGLTEGFASAESMFGARTNEFMIRATTLFASLFLATCLGLAVLSSQKGRSLMPGKVAPVARTPVAAETQTSDGQEEVLDVPEAEAVGEAVEGVPAEIPAEPQPD